MFVSAIVVAAGQGRRLKSKVSKPILKLNSKPIIVYALGVLNSCPEIKEIILVGNPSNIQELKAIVSKYRIRKVNKICLGGKARQDSVAKGIKFISKHAKFILIHDAVRPFISKDLVSLLIISAQKFLAAISAVPVKATIKASDKLGFVKRTVERSNLWEVQTPQVFSRELLLKAYARFKNCAVTDDAMLVEKLGVKVKIVLGTYRNIKITTPEDLKIAKGLA